jgi:hypothetical protein
VGLSAGLISAGLLMVHPFEEVFEAVETFTPEGTVVIEPVDHGGERIGLGAVMGFASFVAMADQLGALEHGQMLGDGGLGDSGVAGEGVDGLLAGPRQFFEDGSAGRVGESAEDGIGIGQRHRKTITEWLWIVKSGDQFFWWRPSEGTEIAVKKRNPERGPLGGTVASGSIRRGFWRALLDCGKLLKLGDFAWGFWRVTRGVTRG